MFHSSTLQIVYNVNKTFLLSCNSAMFASFQCREIRSELFKGNSETERTRG
jgi:hypothetical protein